MTAIYLQRGEGVVVPPVVVLPFQSVDFLLDYFTEPGCIPISADRHDTVVQWALSSNKIRRLGAIIRIVDGFCSSRLRGEHPLVA